MRWRAGGVTPSFGLSKRRGHSVRLNPNSILHVPTVAEEFGIRKQFITSFRGAYNRGVDTDLNDEPVRLASAIM